MELKHFQYKHPFKMIAAGPSGCGKTWFVRNFLNGWRDHIHGISTNELKVLWCHGQDQSIYRKPIAKDVKVTYEEGLLSEAEIKDNLPHILVIDDLMTEVGNNKLLTNLFTKISHHLNIGVIFITQNIYPKGAEMRTVSLNADYLVLFKNNRDKTQIRTLARQLYPINSKFFLEAFEDATSEPYSYISVDLKPDTPDKYRVKARTLIHETPEEIRRRVFPVKIAPVVYSSKR